VPPVSVKMGMAETSRSSAAWRMHSQMVSATQSRELRGRREPDGRVDADLVLGLVDDLGHHGDCMDGILPCDGLFPRA